MENNNQLGKHMAEKITLGDLVEHGELAVVPLLAAGEGGPDYISLKEAFEIGGFSVSEVSESGSVPKLKVTNGTGRNVLMLDGEELAGAKQNRVLNTSILLPADDSRVIPVSCTEQGRWTYTSREFSDSGVMMSRSMRSLKNLAVSDSVKYSRTFDSNQQDLWCGIAEFHRSHRTSSDTGAMKDAYEARRQEFSASARNFPWQEGQCGMAVMVKGRVAGVEFISRPGVYRSVHRKLVESYIMDIPLARAGKSGPSELKVRKILERIAEAGEERFPSVGLGQDCRYEARGLAGSALFCDGWYVHVAFFRNDRRGSGNSEHSDRMTSMLRRREFRGRNRGEGAND